MPGIRRDPVSGPLPPPEPGPFDDWTSDDYLSALRRIADGDHSLSTSDVLMAAKQRGRLPHVPLDLARDLLRTGHWLDLGAIAAGFSESELRQVVADAAAATVSDRPNWALAERSAAWLLARGIALPSASVLPLLSHEITPVRTAGLRLAWIAEDGTRGEVQRLAAGDPDAGVRALAFETLLGWDRDAGGITPETRALLATTLRDGGTQVRAEVSELLPSLGERGAQLAVDLLVEQQPRLDEEFGTSLVRAAVLGGRAAELLRRMPTADVRRSIVERLLAVDPGEFSIPDALVPHLAELSREVGTDEFDDLVVRLARNGHASFVARVALDRRETPNRRLRALWALSSAAETDGGPVETLQKTANRLIWDDSAVVELRIDALMSLRDAERRRPATFELEKRILRDAATPAALRAHVVEELDSEWLEDAYEARRAEFRSLWSDVASSDPSSWVRAMAVERLEDD